MASEVKPVSKSQELISGLLACPACHVVFPTDSNPLVCAKCKSSYGSENGVTRFIPDETWRTTTGAETVLEYQEQFMSDKAAAEYRQLYEGTRSKRMTTRREKAILTSLLASQGHSRAILDVPCGNGRVSGPLAAATDLLIEADTSLGQVLLGRRLADWSTPTAWITASAFEIPLRDNAVDGAVCNRLMHHLPSAEEQERLIAELLRVSRRFVILSFFDKYSIKNLLSQLRGGKKERPCVSAGEVDRLARKHGARLAASPRLFLVGSGQRYALLVKPTV